MGELASDGRLRRTIIGYKVSPASSDVRRRRGELKPHSQFPHAECGVSIVLHTDASEVVTLQVYTRLS